MSQEHADVTTTDGWTTAESVAHRSSREPEELRGALETWLVRTLGAEARPTVTAIAGTAANGQSSETILFDAEWSDAGVPSRFELVARLAPSETRPAMCGCWL